MANSKHLIEFIGNGVHKDSNGDLWCKSHDNPNIKVSREYSDDDYTKRLDIHFMVEYGAMRHTEIDLTPIAPKIDVSAPVVVNTKSEVADTPVKVSAPVVHTAPTPVINMGNNVSGTNNTRK